MRRFVVLSGAGISAESGIATFRGVDGLWNGHSIEDVASPAGWRRDPEMVLEFYNQRRKIALAAQPNPGHYVLANLQSSFDVQIITQNVDDLHERAGSTQVLHLHGLLSQSRSTADPSLIYQIDGWQLKLGDLCEKGSQLRPNIVWFGEPVVLFEQAVETCATADIFVVVGTSLVVYPAAGLVDYVPEHAAKFVIDPSPLVTSGLKNFRVIQQAASSGLESLRQLLAK